jgi:hypothetical protein
VNAPHSTRSGSDIVEVVATVLLALAAVATAWSSYQAARWNGHQAETASRNNAVRIQAARAESQAEAETEVDVALFIQWVDATAAEDDELASFYESRFRAEFQPAFDAWLASEPLTDPDGASTPFAMPEYRLEATAEAERLDAEAEELTATVQQDIQHATNYVLAVVLFAVALFFAGISTKVQGLRARKALVGTGVALFVGTTVWIATFPINLSIG